MPLCLELYIAQMIDVAVLAITNSFDQIFDDLMQHSGLYGRYNTTDVPIQGP